MVGTESGEVAVAMVPKGGEIVAGANKASDLASLNGVLTAATVLLGYTFVKWSIVMSEFLANGVKAEASVFLLLLVIPFGIPLWLIGNVLAFMSFVKFGRGGRILQETMTMGAKFALVADFVLMVCCLIELVVIFSVAS